MWNRIGMLSKWEPKKNNTLKTTVMSMIGNLLRVSEAELNNYRENSALLEERIYRDFDANDIDEAMVDLDKAWNVLAFLLGNTAAEYEDEPLAQLIFGHHTLDEDQDVGYGPARYLTVAEVQELHQALSQLSDEDIQNRFSPAQCEANDIYPSFWIDEDAADLWEYIQNYLTVLRTTYQLAAARKEAMIVYLN